MRLMLGSVPLPIEPGPLVESAIRSTALIAIAALVVLALRRAPAAMRHLVWTLALLGCVAMPLASRVVPGWTLPGLPAWQGGAAAALSLDLGPAPTTVASPAPTRRSPSPEPAAGSSALTQAPAASVAWGPGSADLVRMLPILWLAGVLLMLGRHLLAWASLSRVARRAAPMTDHAWQVALARHGVTLGLARLPAIRVSPKVTVPIVCGALHPTILLPVEAREWTNDRRDAVLLHELAHVRRFDLVTSRVTRLASALYWFDPFVWLAARCQRAEAERACDDRVLDAGGRASAYASDLLEIARAIGRHDRFDTAALAMARRSQLEGRLLAILDPGQPRAAAGRIAISLSVLVAVGIIGVIAAARPVQSGSAGKVEMPASPPSEGLLAAGSPAKPPATGSSHWSITDIGKGESRSGSWNHGDSRGSFKSKGTIRYSAGLDDIVGISPGGHVEIEDRRDRKWHKAVLRGRSGGIERTYSVDGAGHPWDDDARAWLANFLIDLDRSSGIFVEERFPRLMNEGGPARVLREVSDMTSDYSRSLYFRKLLAANLDGSAMRQTVAQAGRELDSDYELARTLIEAAGHNALAEAATRAAFLEATRSLDSDYEHGRVLMVLVERRDLSPGLVEGAIASAATMDSDYEQARVMIAMAGQGHVKPELQGGFIRASRSLESDYEKGRVLKALLDRGRLADGNIGEMLLASATISSDYERANVLVQLAESVPLNDAERAAFVESTKGLSSDYERDRALAALGRTFKR